jgi:hypothetical protein
MKVNRLGVLSAALMMVVVAGSALAQDQTGNRRQRGQGQGQPGQPGQQGQQGRQRFDPAQFREQMMTRLKERLGATDEEWKVLQPKVEKVMASQRDGRGGGGPGGRSGRTRGGDNQQPQQQQQGEQSAVSKAAAELRAAVEDKATSPEEITRRLTAYRDAREKSRADRAAAQKELRELLSARQEAVLVSSGLLD